MSSLPDISSHSPRDCRRKSWFVLLTMLALSAAAVAIGGRQIAWGQAAAEQADSNDSSPGEKPQSDKTRAGGKIPRNPFPDRPKVPEGILDGGKDWLNASGAISIRDLKGKIVLVDFWTYCCINCMHVLPDLKYLEQKYANELVVIGVHSAKFDNEKDSENIRKAVMRYEIEHPVVNDADMTIWRSFGVRAWPTLAMLDPEGHYLGSISGEGHREVLDALIGKLVVYHKAKGTLDETPVKFNLESSKLKSTPLRFPSKVLADEKNGRLFIADTNHNRIVVTTLDGELLDVIGSGTHGKQDGPFAEAQFNHPHGMALQGQTLYVADTGNHLIRSVYLQKQTVSTLAGTGEQARRRPTSAGRLRATALSSPWDLVAVDNVLYIAMAGPHQLWSYRIGAGRIGVFSGSGREDIVDGSHAEAALAQPSGIVSDGKWLYFVDSEGSAVRRASTDPKGGVQTLIGPVDKPFGRLFEFGDVDGVGTMARLQHPIGIAIDGQTLYVADSYNHKIKRIDYSEAGWRATTLLGTGERGDALDPPQFFEPEGLSFAGGKLYIADTNNHRICVADVATRKVTELAIAGLNPPERTAPKASDATDARQAQKVERQTLAAGDTLQFEFALKLPEGYKLNKLAPVTYMLKAAGEQQLFADEELDVRKQIEADGTSVVLNLPVAAETGEAALELSLSFGYCREGVGGLCKIKTARWQIPVKLSADGEQKSVKLEVDATN